MSFPVLSFLVLVIALTLGVFVESWPAVAQEFLVGFAVFAAFCLLEELLEAMKRERSRSPAADDCPLHLTSLRRVAQTSSAGSAAPVAERSLAEARAAEVRELCRPLTLGELIAEVERRCDEETTGATATVASPQRIARDRERAADRGRRGGRTGRQGESSRARARSPPPPRPSEPEPQEPSSPRSRALPPPLAATRRPPGPRYIVAGELGELTLPHRYLVDPELHGHVVSKGTAELLGLRIRPVRGPIPPGFESYAVRSEGGTSEIVGFTTARVKLGFEVQILEFSVVADRVETRLGREVMRPFDLTRDRVNGALRQAGTTRVGIPDPRAFIA